MRPTFRPVFQPVMPVAMSLDDPRRAIVGGGATVPENVLKHDTGADDYLKHDTGSDDFLIWEA